MGYNIRIGNAVVALPEGSQWEFIVEEVTLPEAPAALGDAEPNLHRNVRWPSYSGWKDFALAADLDELLFGEDGLMRPHPGCAILREADAERIEHALSAYRERYPRAVARFGIDEDAVLARLEWLAWWCDGRSTTASVPPSSTVERRMPMKTERPSIVPSTIMRQAADVPEPRKIALIIVDALRNPGAKGEPPVLPSVGEDAEKIDALLAVDQVDWEALDAIISRYDQVTGR